MRSEAINEMAAALAKAQGEIENAALNKINPHFKNKYADLASVRDSIRAPLAKNGISYTQTMEFRETGMVLVTTLWHTSGQWISSEYPLPTTARPQELGSALTYARRYSLSAIVGNSADEDDDAEAAETAKQKIEAAGKGKTAVKPPKTEPPLSPAGKFEPHTIQVPKAGDSNDWMRWGASYASAISAAPSKGDIAEWAALNLINLDKCIEEAPKIADRITAVTKEAVAKFG